MKQVIEAVIQNHTVHFNVLDARAVKLLLLAMELAVATRDSNVMNQAAAFLLLLSLRSISGPKYKFSFDFESNPSAVEELSRIVQNSSEHFNLMADVSCVAHQLLLGKRSGFMNRNQEMDSSIYIQFKRLSQVN